MEERSLKKLTKKFKGAKLEFSKVSYPLLWVRKEDLFEVAKELKENKDLDFDHLSFVSAVDNLGSSEGAHFEVVYVLHSYKYRQGLILKTKISRDNPKAPSLTSLWGAADLHEREAYDLFGIIFEGHSSLERLFLFDDFPGHPLRKDLLLKNDEKYLLKERWEKKVGRNSD